MPLPPPDLQESPGTVECGKAGLRGQHLQKPPENVEPAEASDDLIDRPPNR